MTAPFPQVREVEPPATAEVGRSLDTAALRVIGGGGQLTHPRRRVLELLLIAAAPVKADDLVARFHPGLRVAQPATVYRALKFLEANGFVRRLSTIKSYVAWNPDCSGPTAAFLLCDFCGSCRQIPSPTMASLAAAAARLGYAVERITLEAQGTCSACRLPTPGSAHDAPASASPRAIVAPRPAEQPAAAAQARTPRQALRTA